MLGNRLREYRKSKKMTQREFAEKLGIARSTLADYENKRIKGSRTFINKLCDVTNTPPSVWITSDTKTGIQLRDLETLYMAINTLISSGTSTLEDPLPQEYREPFLKLLEMEIKNIIIKNNNIGF